jgi:hypothetical protein
MVCRQLIIGLIANLIVHTSDFVFDFRAVKVALVPTSAPKETKCPPVNALVVMMLVGTSLDDVFEPSTRLD